MAVDFASTLDLLIAGFVLAGMICGAVLGADRLLGRRITAHNAKLQETIEAIKSEFKVSMTTMTELLGKQEQRLTRLEDHVPTQNEKISYIQGQSDTMLKIMGVKDLLEKGR